MPIGVESQRKDNAMVSPSLYEVTRELLINRHRKITLQKIEADLPGHSIKWLSELSNGRMKDPSVNKIQALYEYLSGKPLLD